MHISIEGMDGVGKTISAKKVAEKLGFTFIEKPFHLLIGDGDGIISFKKLLYGMRNMKDTKFKALFLGTINYYLSSLTKEMDVVTDRHLASNYLQYHSEETNDIFDCLVELCGKPELTVVFYATPEERKNRIIKRNPNDKDLDRPIFDDEGYKKIMECLNRYEMNYIWLDTTNMDIDQVVERVIDEVRKLNDKTGH